MAPEEQVESPECDITEMIKLGVVNMESSQHQKNNAELGSPVKIN